MTYLQAIILAIIQGLTEFLPVSSSAHLVLAQNYMPGFTQPGVLFDIMLHIGTTTAVLFYFRDRIVKVFRKDWYSYLIATIPAGVVGVLFSDFLESLFASIFFVGVTLLISALFNFYTDKAQGRRENITGLDAFFVGVAQALAIIPGISRSSATIFAGTSLGISRQAAAEFSFLLSVPAIIGATGVQLVKYGDTITTIPGPYIVGTVVSGIVGFASIGVLLRLLTERRFKYFAYYCVVVGIASIVISLR